MVEGMSTALAASAKWAKTPNLLGDIIGCIQGNRAVGKAKGCCRNESSEEDETKEG
jgi:hypothetical protein